jgi:TRAP-type C4-dicarboxylate transport system substrate-binding protein
LYSFRHPAAIGFTRLLGAALLFAGLASCQRDTDLVIRIGTYVPEQSVGIRTVIKPWMDAVAAELPPGIRFQSYWGGSLGRDAFAQYDLVKHGVLDIAWVLPGYTAGQFPQIDIIELPYLVRSATEAALAGWQLHAEGLIDGTQDVQVIGIWSTDVATIQTVNPLPALSDVRNLKIRTAGSVQASFIALLGGISETMSAIEMNEAIQRGSIDGVVQAWSGIRTFRTDRLMRSAYQAPLGALPFMLLMNRNTWDKLSPEVQALFMKHGGETLSHRAGAQYDAIANGIRDEPEVVDRYTFVVPDEAQNAANALQLRPIHDEWIRKRPNGRAVYDRFVALLEALRANNVSQ